MNIVKGMPCHITAMGDAPDNTMSDREISDENEAIREIADTLIEGDKYRIYGNHDVDFCVIVEEDLTSNLEFANALRKVAGYTGISGCIGDLAKIIDDEVLSAARVIYEEKGE
jgi:hypothetical protein